MQRYKTFDSTGVAPNGRLFSGDLNAIQDAAAALTDLLQNLSVGTLTVGQSGLTISRFAAGVIGVAGDLRASGLVQAISGIMAGSFSTAGRNAIVAGKRPTGMVIWNTDNGRLEVNAGSDTTPNWQPLGAQTVSLYGTLAVRPAANSVAQGSTYYANDQVAQYMSDGTNWGRISGGRAGDVILTFNSAAEPGRILAQGQAWPSTTGIYADLFAKIGAAYPTVLPDLRGRVPVGLGTHADVNAIGLTEGLAVGSRRPKHKHTVGQPAISQPAVNITDPTHTHPLTVTLALAGAVLRAKDEPASSSGQTVAGGANGVQAAATGITAALAAAPVATGGTVGPQSGNEPTDSEAYITVNFEMKL